MEWWILIPIAAIMVGAFKEWLKFKSKQEQLGASTHELEDELQALQKELAESEEQRAALERRIQNLETIVTSEQWDALVADTDRDAVESGPRLELPEESDAVAKQAEQIARRLRG